MSLLRSRADSSSSCNSWNNNNKKKRFSFRTSDEDSTLPRYIFATLNLILQTFHSACQRIAVKSHPHALPLTLHTNVFCCIFFDACFRLLKFLSQKCFWLKYITQSKSKTIITRSMLTISLIVFTDKFNGHVHTFYTIWFFITF